MSSSFVAQPRQDSVGNSEQGKISYFPESSIKGIPLPERFTFPFCYEPHPLTRIAAAELQQYLQAASDLDHNFGLPGSDTANAIGKMFGVLVVADREGRIGYLAAFSGKLAGTNDHDRFVPPVFDMLSDNSFFLQGIERIDFVNAALEARTADPDYIGLKASLATLTARCAAETAALKEVLKANREIRRQRREDAQLRLDEADVATLDAELIRQSLADKRQLRALTSRWQETLLEPEARMRGLEDQIQALREERRERSAALQERLFEQYTFLNRAGTSRSLQEIFRETAFGQPPSAAGECATPKLLQYAFRNGCEPLAMAEFWWGASPKSEIRKHGHFYPACAGKCKPILSHMLDGMDIDDNPLLRMPANALQLPVVYEDAELVVVNKPSGLRSVPGVDVIDSVYSRLKCNLGDTEPLIVHRLDMDTSGLLVVAKSPEAHRHLQKQFLRRTVSKRYTALLSGTLTADEGEIRLPLAADPFDRPRQLVCMETGKKSITRWKLIDSDGGISRVHFWPLTGRTHQLRVHAAHRLGLGTPIVGDDLYGTPAERLYLHAAQLAFIHPLTKQQLSFEAPEEF